MKTEQAAKKPAPKKTTKKPAAKAKAAGSAVRARKVVKPKVMGRPTVFSDAIANRICTELAEGMSLRQICSAQDMPDRGTVVRWLANPEHAEFCNQYAHARGTPPLCKVLSSKFEL